MQRLGNASYSAEGETTGEERRGSLDQINRRQFKMLNLTSSSSLKLLSPSGNVITWRSSFGNTTIWKSDIFNLTLLPIWSFKKVFFRVGDGSLSCPALPRVPLSVKQCVQHRDVFLLASALEKKGIFCTWYSFLHCWDMTVITARSPVALLIIMQSKHILECFSWKYENIFHDCTVRPICIRAWCFSQFRAASDLKEGAMLVERPVAVCAK